MRATLNTAEVRGLCCELCTIYTLRGRMWAIHPKGSGSIVWMCNSCRDKVMQAECVKVEDGWAGPCE